MKFLSLSALSIAIVASSAFNGYEVPTAKRSSTELNVSPIGRRQAFLSTAAALTAGVSVVRPVSAKEPMQTYLTEPTEEFKESERERMVFRQAQLKIKKKFTDLLGKFTADKSEDDLRTDLEDLKELVADSGGLPLGIKKDDIVKQIRAKKALGFWPTSVEYAYQAVIREIAYQQSPNKDKDLKNPL